jgi:hypothetical protein
MQSSFNEKVWAMNQEHITKFLTTTSVPHRLKITFLGKLINNRRKIEIFNNFFHALMFHKNILLSEGSLFLLFCCLTGVTD